MPKVGAALARLAMALWAGAVAAVGVVVAPRVFGFLDDKARAGELMGPIFRKVDLFGIFAALLFAVAARRSRWRLAIAVLLGVAAAANAFILGPRIPGGSAALHHVAEALWALILLWTLVLALVGPPTPPPHSQP